MAFARFFEFALLFWVPFFFLVFFIKQWKLTVIQTIAWIITAGLIAAALTAGVILLIITFG